MRLGPVLLVSVLLGGCAGFWAVPPEVPFAMSTGDNRRQLSGTWQLALTIDSTVVIRRPADSTPPLPVPRTAFGTLRITDTLVSKRRPDVMAFMAPTYHELVGSNGPIAAVFPAGTTPLATGGCGLGIRRHGKGWIISLTPGVQDYSITLEGSLAGDSLSGAWAEQSWGGVMAGGTFVMHRVQSGEGH